MKAAWVIWGGAVLLWLWVIWVIWEWRSAKEIERLINILSIPFALIGLGLLFWRSWSGDKQAKAAQDQSESAQEQIKIARLSHLNERFQKGVELLGNKEEAGRIGGVYALDRLSREQVDEYHLQVLKIFCSAIRDNVPVNETEGPRVKLSIQVMLDCIGSRTGEQIEHEKKKKYHLNLRKAQLPHTLLRYVNLSDAQLFGANLSGADLWDVDLSDADLDAANLTGVKNLSQRQLDKAVLVRNIRPNPEPPTLSNAIDSESKTGERLKWQGRTINKREDKDAL